MKSEVLSSFSAVKALVDKSKDGEEANKKGVDLVSITKDLAKKNFKNSKKIS